MANTKRFILPLSFAIFSFMLLLFSVTTNQSDAASELYEGRSRVPSATFPVLVDFEGGIPAGFNKYTDKTNGAPDTDSIITETVEAALMPMMPLSATNQVLAVDYWLDPAGGWGPAWGGFAQGFSATQDWSAYAGFSFWFYGNNSGLTYQAEIFDNGTSDADAERWDYSFTDDFTGWKLFTVPFADFTRATDFQPGGAPTDGVLNLDAMWGFAFIFQNASSASFKLDQVQLFKADNILVDFEGGIPAGFNKYTDKSNGAPDTDSVITETTEAGLMPVVPISATNQVLAADYWLDPAGGWGPAWGGFAQGFSATQDWSAYTGFTFWFYGTNTGHTYQAEIFDNGTSDADAERWDYSFTDDFTGWKLFAVPFTDFTRATDFQPGGAPTDGVLNLDAMWGMAFIFQNATAGSFKLDAIGLFGEQATVVTPPDPPSAAAPTFPVLIDFEAGVPNGFNSYTDKTNGAPNTDSIITTTVGSALMPMMPLSATNQVLSSTYWLDPAGGWGPAWGGYAWGYTQTQAWDDYDGFSFWFYGMNTGHTYQAEIFDNGSSDADAERWDYSFTDDFTGWKLFEIPFSDFARATDFQPGGAPTDGVLNLDAMWGFAFIFENATSGSFMLDQVQLYTNDTILIDFESGIPAGFNKYTDKINGAPNTDSVITETTEAGLMPMTPISATNQVLAADYWLDPAGGWGAGWGGFANALAPAQDWTDYKGFTFWFYGTNTGNTYQAEIFDNGTSDADAERWDYSFTDDFTGWKLFEIPFTDFTRATDFQPGGAPTDGVLNLDAMWGFAFIFENGTAGSLKIDNVGLYGAVNVSVKVGFESSAYTVIEGDTAEITVALTAASATPVTVTVNSTDGAAVAPDDYAAVVNQEVIIPAGNLKAALSVATVDDSDSETVEDLTLTLASTGGVSLTTSSTTLSITDNDAVTATAGSKAAIIETFTGNLLPESTDAYTLGIGWVTWGDTWAGTTVAITTGTTADFGIPVVPGMAGTNEVLQLKANVNGWGGFTHAFENAGLDTWVSQDWSSYVGISLWYYGTGTGTDVLIEISENRNPGSTTADAEIWSYTHSDTTAGWQLIELPFSSFARKDIGNGAPDDGWSGQEVYGWSIGTLGTSGSEEIRYVDHYGLLERVTVVDDFTNNALLEGTDADALGIGWVTWGDTWAGTTVAITTETTTNFAIDPVPGKDGTNEVLQLKANVNGWGGFTHAFENAGLDTWVSQDWSSYAGICFWYYGTGTGTDVLIEFSENRNPGSTTADAEIWSYTHADSVAGWQLIQLPFSSFARKDIGNGAPDDGFTGAEVHGWSIGTLTTSGSEEIRYVDDFSLYGQTSALAVSTTVQFGSVEYLVSEGDTVDVAITLNQTTTVPVSVTYSTGDSYAIINRDFVPISGTVVIAAGEMTATVTVTTIEDRKFEATEALLLSIDSAENADLGFAKRTRVKIVNDDTEDLALIHDFEGWQPFEAAAGLETSIVEVMTGTALAIPGQDTYEQVLAVSGAAVRAGAATLGTTFVEPQDWSSSQGVSFWYYGNGSGESVTFELLDNAASSTGTVTDTDWVQIWEQDFNGPAGTVPDSDVWSYELNDGFLNELSGWGNSELQYYTNSPDNAAMDGSGNLVITLKDLNDPTLHCHYGTCTQSSARLISEGKAEFLYGEIEARVQVPTGPAGLWPAFWMLGTDLREVGWPQSGEIDIVEYVSRIPNEIFGTIHGPGYSGGQGYGRTYDLGGRVDSDYHVFKIVWHPNRIEWYVDNVLYHTAEPSDVAPNEWVYNHPFHLILNLAIGGNFGGAVDSSMSYPQTMLVDYITVKGAPDTAERFEAQFIDNAVGWKKFTIPFSAFTRSDVQPTGAPTDGILDLTAINGYGLIPATSNTTRAAVTDFMMDQIRLEATVADQEYDGVEDAVEDGAPNSGDGNGDGILDKLQTDVSSLPNAVNANYVTLDADGNALLNVSASNPMTMPTGISSLPYGSLNFAISTTVGGSVQVTVTVHGASAGDFDTVWKQASDGSWFQFPYSTTTGTGAVINGTTIVLHLTDGAWGDIDGVANGRIVDPMAPASSAVLYQYYFPFIIIDAQTPLLPTDAAVLPVMAPTVYREDAEIEQTDGDQ